MFHVERSDEIELENLNVPRGTFEAAIVFSLPSIFLLVASESFNGAAQKQKAGICGR